MRLGVDAAGEIVDDVDGDEARIPLRRPVGQTAIFIGRLDVGCRKRRAVMKLDAFRSFTSIVEASMGVIDSASSKISSSGLSGFIGARVR